jgi:hypothetical protein
MTTIMSIQKGKFNPTHHNYVHMCTSANFIICHKAVELARK